MYGVDYAYANTRLTETIVFRGDSAVYCHRVREDGRALITPLNSFGGRGEQDLVPLTALDVKPRRLGYVNYEGNVTYVMRVPKRRDYRQGLRGNTMTCVGPLDIHSIPLHRITHMLEGAYPSFTASLVRVREAGDEACAWNREWAVMHGDHLLYKGDRIVGRVVEDQPMLNEEYQWLQESLRDSL